MQLTFEHALRSSRKFVFENIMDLEHVCVVHRRWFRNLRVRVQRSDYVEYRLTGWFYGFAQEVLARGGPVDADHYWYEFITRVARMRVEGTLAGLDGNLQQTEIVTFEFSPVLAPFMWLLRPLFIRQKHDILRDDTALLEREYEFEKAGFQRHDAPAQKIVVYGGNGFFGRIVVEELLRTTSARIDVVSRTARRVDFKHAGSRVRFVESDLRNPDSVRQTITGADLVVVAAGPFQRMPLTVLEACIAERVSYIDVADDRDFVRRVYELAESRTIPQGMVILTGCSVVPGLTAILTRVAQRTIPRICQTKIAISPGTRHPRGPGSFGCLLATVGQHFTAPTRGNEAPVVGWTEPERVQFPAPMGQRTCYRVVDIADNFIQPRYFGTETVEFRIGSEFWLLNFSLSVLRGLSQALRVPAKSFMSVGRMLIYWAAPFGTTAGGVVVEITGHSGEEPRSESWCVFAETGGERIPSLPAAIAAKMILNRQIRTTGLVPLPDWINPEQLFAELANRGVRVATRTSPGEWHVVN